MARRQRESPAEGRARRAAIDDPAVVLEAAARFLEVRPRSVAEVRRRLGQNGYRADLVDDAIERLAGLGMLDDTAFATAWVESRDRARPRSARALRDELRRKGVPPDDIEAALAAREATAAGGDEPELAIDLEVGQRAQSGEADRDAAARLLDRRGAAFLRESDPRKRRAKAYALLARSGFDPETCATAVNRWLADRSVVEAANDAGEGDDRARDEG